MVAGGAAHLFVYGTLTRAADGEAMGAGPRLRLRAETEFVSAATLAGDLYDLGRFPGFVESVAGRPARGRVHGELLRLRRAATTLRWLDDYEGVDPNGGDGGLYRRVLRAAHLVSGRTVEAWVYLYLRDVPTWRRIETGRWADRS